MEGISDIKIVAIDSKRPPVLRKTPYIDLFFELSHQVPKAWGEDFNALLSKHKFPAKIQFPEGLYIETWVRTPEDVATQFEHLKSKVAENNDLYVAKIEKSRGQKADSDSTTADESGEQGRLNRIVAGLDFGD